MALSLWQHLQDAQRSTSLSRLTASLGSKSHAELVFERTVALTLAHLVSLNQRHGRGLVLALVNTRTVSGLWQTLDQTAVLKALGQDLGGSPDQLAKAVDDVAACVLEEVFMLVDMACLGEEGLAELLEGQPEHLQGHAPDWVWTLSGLEDLRGQAVVEEAPALDVAAGIASLTALMHNAQHQQEELAMGHAAHHDDHHPVVAEPVFRAAGSLARALAPVPAILILGLLTCVFSHNPKTNNLSMLEHHVAEPAAQVAPSEQPAEPLVMTDATGQAVEIPLPPVTPASTLAEVQAINTPPAPSEPTADVESAPAQ
jgi:hypothetical protein